MMTKFLGLLFLIVILSQSLCAHLNPTDTLEQIERKLEAEPDNTSLLLDRAHILTTLGRLNEAETTLRRVDKLEKERSADTTYLYILLYQRHGDLDKAFELSDQGIRRFPDNFYQWEIRAQLSLETGKTDMAVEALSHSLRINKGATSRGYIHITTILLERDREGDKERALALLREGIDQLGQPSELLHLSIRLNTEMQRFDEALKNVRMLEQHYGFQVPFAVNRAEILELAGRNAAAADAYGNAISLLDALRVGKRNQQVERMIQTFEEAKVRVLASDKRQ